MQHKLERHAPTHPQGRVRDWVNAASFLVEHNRLDPHAVVMLMALAEAALKSGTAEVAHGTRSLAIATGLDHVTVSRVLAALRAADDPLIVRTGEAVGTQADVYELCVPVDLEPVVARRRWRRGKIHARRPVLRVLGLPASFVYEALVAADGPVSGLELFDHVPYGSKTTIDDALATLAAHGLATQVVDGRRPRWITGPASPSTVAERPGVTEIVRAIIARIREQRRIWHEWLLARLGVRGAWMLNEPPPEHPDDPDPPPPDIDLAFTSEEQQAMWDDPYWNSYTHI